MYSHLLIFSSSMLLMVVWLPIYNCSSITLVVPPRSQDCLYLEKEKGDKIVTDIQVVSGHKISVRLIKPDKTEWSFHSEIQEVEIDKDIEERGEYAFCFLNPNSYLDGATVQFEYDLHEEGIDKESKFKKQLKQEKKMFIKEQLRKMQPKIAKVASQVTGVEGHGQGVDLDDDDDEDFGNDTLKEVQESILILSLQMDRMEHFLKKHTARMAYQHYVQKENRSFIAFFSGSLSIIIIFVGCIQVVFLKGFINGKRSWKFWKF